MGQVNLPDNWIDISRRLQEQIDELRGAMGLSSAVISRGGLSIINNGSFTMRDGSGTLVMFVGPDGAGNQIFQLWRPGGASILLTQKDIPSGRMFFAMRDFLGHIIFADDVQTGGMARPYLSVPMYPLFSMAASTIYPYMNVAVASITSETLLWEGHIPLVSHPRIMIDGVWGTATGANSSTYKLYVNGSVVGTWSLGGITAATEGPYDVSSLLDNQNVIVQLKASASGTGNVAAQVLGCYLRQT